MHNHAIAAAMTRTYKPELALLLVTLLASTGWIFSRLALVSLSPTVFIFVRFLTAAVCIYPFAARALREMTRAQVLISAKAGLLQAIVFFVWTQAVQSAESLSEGAFITSLSMIMVPFLARLVYGKKLSRNTLLALPFAITGIAFLALDGSWSFEPAQLLFLTSSFFIAMHFIYTSRHAAGLPPLAMTFIQMLVVSGVGLLASLVMGPWPDTVPTSVWLSVLGVAVIATSLRYVLLTYGLKNADTSLAALISILEPVWATALSVYLLGEVLSGQNLFGCGLIILALIISVKKSGRHQQTSRTSVTSGRSPLP